MTVECVPNISEGRDLSVVRAVADAAQAVPGVTLMGCSSDADHHRSVISFLGAPPAVERAAVALAGEAVRRIDLTGHRGVHPRIGAADVIPFVPLRGTGMEACIDAARRVGAEIFGRYGVPVYLYGHAASSPCRQNLADVRRNVSNWPPDFGSAPHPTAGAVAVGAREVLIAFNVNLDTPDVAVAKAIARAVRESGGGLPCVKALGLMLESRGRAQVSVNLTDWRVTPPYAVLEAVRAEAARLGAGVAGTEIVGLTPAAALPDDAVRCLGLENFDADTQVLEKYML